MGTDNGFTEYVHPADDGEFVGEISSEVGPIAVVPVWVLDQDLTNSELRVYLALRSFADQAHRHAYPRMATIAARAKVSQRSTERAISGLRDKGLIRTKQRRRDDGSIAGCDYWLRDTPPKDVSDTPLFDIPPSVSGGPVTTDGTVTAGGRGTDRAVGGVPSPVAEQEQTMSTDHVEQGRSFVAAGSDARSASRRGALRSPAPRNDDERLEQRLGPLAPDEAMRADAMLANGANVRLVENTVRRMRREDGAPHRAPRGETHTSFRDPWAATA